MTRNGTPSIARGGRPERGELLGRTALCGALAALAAVVASPALALPTQARTPAQVNTGGVLPDVASTATETDVTLHAPRTVIDWTNYNVAAGQTVKYTFDARNWIVLNRVQSSAPPTISGTIEGRVNGAFGGNIWFASRNGMIFGAGAQVDAGGILISAAAPDLTTFLDPANLSFNFSGSELTADSTVTLKAGSSINGHGGLVALISPVIVGESGSSVSGQGGSNVLYGSTRGFQLHLQQGAPGDFDLVDFIVPDTSFASGAGTALDLQNTTAANSVFLAAVNRSAAASAVINLQGMITAQAAATDGGDIILSGGGGIVGRAAGPAVAGGANTDFYLGSLSASRDIKLQGQGQVFGAPFVSGAPAAPSGGAVDPTQVSNLTAGRDISLAASQAIVLGSANAGRSLTTDSQALQANALTASGAVTLKSETGDIDLGALTANGGGVVQSAAKVQIDTLTAGSTLTVQATTDLGLGADGSGVASGGTITLKAGGAVNVDLATATLDTVTAGGVANLKAGSLTVRTISGQQVLAQGGSVSLGSATSAGDVYVVSTGGAATLGTATAGDDVVVLANGGTASLTQAVLTGGGADTVGPQFSGNPDGAGNGRVVFVQSTNGDAHLGLAAGSVSGAGRIDIKAGQDAAVDLLGTGAALLSVTAGRDASLRAPSVSLDAVSAGRDITLTATSGDVTSTHAVTAPHNFTVTSPGAVQLADVTASSGSISLTGGSVTAGALAAGQDLTLKAGAGAVKLVSFQAGQDLTVQGGVLSLGQQLAPIGRDLSITTANDFTSATDLAAGRNITLAIGGSASLKGLSGPGAVTVTANDATLGGPVSTADLSVKTTAGLTSAVDLSTTHSLTLTAGGAATLKGLAAPGAINLTAGSATLGGAVSGGDLAIKTTGAFSTSADLTATHSLTLSSGGSASVKNLAAPGTVTLTAADLTLGGTVHAADLSISTTGALTTTTDLATTHSLTLTSGGAAILKGLSAPSSVTVSGSDVTLNGAINTADLSVRAGGALTSNVDLSASHSLTLSAGGAATLKGLSSPGAVSLAARSATIAGSVSAGDLSINATGAFTASGDLAATHGITLGVGGLAQVNNVTGPGSVDIVAGDLALGGTLSGTNVQIESANGALRVGGSASDGAPASGLWLDNAEFGRIRASGQLNLYAGATGGSARGDLTLLALDVNPQATPRVNFLVGGGHDALVQGTVAPTTSGGTVHIGDSADTAWRPTSILISGAIGAATFSRGAYSDVHAFDDVRLFATQDIIMGSERFIGLIQSAAVADIDVGRNKPGGVAPTAAEQNHVLIATGVLELSASGKVVSQNTSPTVAQSVGLFLNGRTPPELILDPPQLVDIYGAFINSAGTLVSNFSGGGGIPFAIVDSAGNPIAAPEGAVYRFNSCAVGTTQCSAVATVTSNLQQNNPVLATTTGPPLGSDLGSGADSGAAGDSGGAAGGGGGRSGSRGPNDRNAPPSLLSSAPGAADDLLLEPVVAGAGSEEIWRKRERDAKPETKPETKP